MSKHVSEYTKKIMDDISESGSVDATVHILANNIRRVFKKMAREAPLDDEHSTLVDLINHGDSLAQQIESKTDPHENLKQMREKLR